MHPLLEFKIPNRSGCCSTEYMFDCAPYVELKIPSRSGCCGTEYMSDCAPHSELKIPSLLRGHGRSCPEQADKRRRQQGGEKTSDGDGKNDAEDGSHDEEAA